MVVLAGVHVPDAKAVRIGLTAICGVGFATAQRICCQLSIHRHCKVQDLSEAQIASLSQRLSAMTVESELRREVHGNIKRLVDIGAYRGLRHRDGLPVKGQTTRGNRHTARKLNAARLQ